MSILRKTINEKFNGVVLMGQHDKGGKACALEAAHAAVGDKWSDYPDRWPDIRPINDGPWSSDEKRTANVVPLLEALWYWENWPLLRRKFVMETVVLETIRHIISDLPGLSDETRKLCRRASDLTAAYKAAVRVTADADSVRTTDNATDAILAGAVSRAADSAIRATAAAVTADATDAAVSFAAAATSAVADAADTAVDANAVLAKACNIWIDATIQ